MLSISRGFLELFGFSVLTAGEADRGIEIFRERKDEIAAVLIDLSMPGKSGIEIFQELRGIDPSVKAILASGMLDNESNALALQIGISETIHKPYLARELSDKLKSLFRET